MKNQQTNKTEKAPFKKRTLFLGILTFMAVGLVLYFTVSFFLGKEPAEGSGTESDSTVFENEIGPDEIIFSINGETIPMSEFCYHLYDSFGKMESQFMTSELNFSLDMGEGMTLGEYIIKNSVDGVKFSRVVDKLAEDLDVDKAKIETEVDEYLASTIRDAFQGDEDAFKEQLALMGTTLGSFRRIMISQSLGNQVFEHYYGEKGTVSVDPSAYYDRFATASNILFLTVTSEVDAQTGQNKQVPISDEEIAQKRTLADAVLEQLNSGADFYELLNQYGEDTGVALENNPKQQYTFQKNEMNYELSNAVFSTEIGKYSDLIESSYGFYIVYRLPLDTEAVDEAAKTTNFRYGLFNEMLDGLSAEYDFEPSLLFQNAVLTDWYNEYKAKNY